MFFRRGNFDRRHFSLQRAGIIFAPVFGNKHVDVMCATIGLARACADKCSWTLSPLSRRCVTGEGVQNWTRTAYFSYLFLELNAVSTCLPWASFWTESCTEQICTVAGEIYIHFYKVSSLSSLSSLLKLPDPINWLGRIEDFRYWDSRHGLLEAVPCVGFHPSLETF